MHARDRVVLKGQLGGLGGGQWSGLLLRLEVAELLLLQVLCQHVRVGLGEALLLGALLLVLLGEEVVEVSHSGARGGSLEQEGRLYETGLLG